MSTAGLRNVSCPTFDGHEYPRWKAMMKKRLMAMDNELWTVTEIGLTDLCKMAEADDIRKYTTEPHSEGCHLLLPVPKSVQERHAPQSREANLGPTF